MWLQENKTQHKTQQNKTQRFEIRPFVLLPTKWFNDRHDTCYVFLTLYNVRPFCRTPLLVFLI